MVELVAIRRSFAKHRGGGGVERRRRAAPKGERESCLKQPKGSTIYRRRRREGCALGFPP